MAVRTSLSLARCIVSGNSSETGQGEGAIPGRGGGIDAGDGRLTITNSAVISNAAWYGGAIFGNDVIVIKNSTIAANFISSAAIEGSSSTVFLANSTVTGNLLHPNSSRHIIFKQ